jgi:hypothetical protein
MDFNNLIKEQLGPIFQKYEFKIAEEFSYYIRLESRSVNLIFVYNQHERSSNCSIDIGDKVSYEIDDDIMSQIFKSDLKINNLTPDVFVTNLVSFFKNEGEILLKGDVRILSLVKEYVWFKSQMYTMKLVESQNLQAADDAWKKGDYKQFIKCIDKVVYQHPGRAKKIDCTKPLRALFLFVFLSFYLKLS